MPCTFFGRSDGLLSLRAAKGMDKGYVIYTGTEVRQVADRIWTLPLPALNTPAAFRPE
ncbi:MAG: hypothetical protein FWF36_07240 [Propionibacteriaceae bacterium]|nr:hypothetical protein [Propionibacteriaceae bacterium]